MKKSLRILCIGNSFSCDMCAYAYETAVSMGFEDVFIGNLYIPGCSLSTHLANSRTNEEKYQYQYIEKGEWKDKPISLEAAIKEREWDVITMQQASHYSGLDETYKANLLDLVSFVKDKVINKDVKLYWHMTWAYDHDSTHPQFYWFKNDIKLMYESIVKSVQAEIVPNKDFAGIIKNGIAFQYLRDEKGIEHMTRDGFHASINFGRIVLAINFISTVTGEDASKATFLAPEVNEEQLALAKEAVKYAQEYDL